MSQYRTKQNIFFEGPKRKSLVPFCVSRENLKEECKCPTSQKARPTVPMLGHIAPTKVDETQKHNIDLISNDTLWKECELSIKRSLNCFAEHGIELPVKEYMFTILLANCESPYIILNGSVKIGLNQKALNSKGRRFSPISILHNIM